MPDIDESAVATATDVLTKVFVQQGLDQDDAATAAADIVHQAQARANARQTAQGAGNDELAPEGDDGQTKAPQAESAPEETS